MEEKMILEVKIDHCHPITPPISKEKKNPKLTAFDLINILTRQHLKVMLNEYSVISHKHSEDLNKPLVIKSCSDLKRGEISRLDELKDRFFTVRKNEYEKERMKKRKGATKTSSSSTVEKNVDPDREMNLIHNDMIEKIKEFHRFNIELFSSATTYRSVGFHDFRYDQCPNVSESKTFFESGKAPNWTLQETMLSLRITEEGMISEYIQEEEIRILSFVPKQDKSSVMFYISIPELLQHEGSIITLTPLETGFSFYVEKHKEKNYIFEIENLANKINSKPSFLIVNKDLILIEVQKKKQRMWKNLFHYRNETKSFWEEEMKEVLNTVTPDAEIKTEPLEIAWKIALILVNCRADLLNLPRDLNHVKRNFTNIFEMILFYKNLIPFNPHLKALFYIYGGALLYKLTVSTSSTTPRKKTFSKYQNEMEKNIAELIETTERNHKEGSCLYFDEKYEEAYSFFNEISSVCIFPSALVMRGICLRHMRRYREAIMDSIFGLRNLGTYQGFPSLLNILQCKITSGDVIHAMDVATSFEFNHRQLNKTQKHSLMDIRLRGHYFLSNIFQSHSFIFQKKYTDAIPFLEEAEKVVLIKSGYTSVILLLLYFVSKKYEDVFNLGNEILENCNVYRSLVYYLLAMSAFYTKQLRLAMKYFEEIKICNLVDYTRIKILSNLIHTGDDLMKDSKMEKELGWHYRRAITLVEDNEQILAHIYKKLGVINFVNGDYKEAVECLSRSIDLDGENKNEKYITCMLVVRSVAYDKLGMVNEAKEDRKDVHKRIVIDAKDENETERLELKENKK
ncbi:UNVERIFIED_CONTAM: hypothetical protein RMT77_015957 [Armadillidium vulgare]